MLPGLPELGREYVDLGAIGPPVAFQAVRGVGTDTERLGLDEEPGPVGVHLRELVPPLGVAPELSAGLVELLLELLRPALRLAEPAFDVPEPLEGRVVFGGPGLELRSNPLDLIDRGLLRGGLVLRDRRRARVIRLSGGEHMLTVLAGDQSAEVFGPDPKVVASTVGARDPNITRHAELPPPRFRG